MSTGVCVVMKGEQTEFPHHAFTIEELEMLLRIATMYRDGLV
jgi:hypothetical protein